MKRTIFLLLILSLVLVGCSKKESNSNTIRVGATPVPHAEILQIVKDDLQEKGYTLEIKEFTDYIQPNVQVQEGELDANFFQHLPYLEEFNKERNYNLVSVGAVHIEPIGLYSNKIKTISELKDGSILAIPSDATNGARALKILENQGIIKLKDGAGIQATIQDIVDNPKNLVFKELEAAVIPRALEDVELAAINTNYALENNLDPKTAIVQEEAKDNPYANVLVVKDSNRDNQAIKALIEALQSDKVREFIETKYNGSIISAF